MKKVEMFQELSVKLAVLESKLDKIVELIQPKVKQTSIEDVQKVWDEITQPKWIAGKIPCMYDTVDPSKAMGLVCKCPKHSAYALSSGSLSDSGSVQIWNKDRPVDCVSTTFIPSGDIAIE